MISDLQPEALDLKSMLSNGQYIIPIYQRNYAWEASEIEQLIQDIYDHAIKKEVNNYYLGSLVVNVQDTHFETIDGQQRYTTLSIILSVLKHSFKKTIPELAFINLTFESRDESHATLQHLYKHGLEQWDDKLEPSLLEAYTIASKNPPA